MAKVHLVDWEEDNKVPFWDENKLNGYTICKCGYQRKRSTHFDDEVTCKICLRYIKKFWEEHEKKKIST
jgi:Zn ribbon nucleic-acid-binding protein